MPLPSVELGDGEAGRDVSVTAGAVSVMVGVVVVVTVGAVSVMVGVVVVVTGEAVTVMVGVVVVTGGGGSVMVGVVTARERAAGATRGGTAFPVLLLLLLALSQRLHQ